MLQARGLPPTLSLLAESLLDGRLPPRSIAWLKIQTIAVNIRATCEGASLDEGVLSFSLPILFYINNPYICNIFQ